MIKVCKFGGSSVADAGQFLKIKNIVKSDKSRKFVVVSAVGKANKDDHKITDLLYVLYSHVKYGVDYESILKIVEDKYNAIKNELGLSINLDAEFDEIRKNLNKHCDVDYVVSRGEYLSAKLMADYLGGIFVPYTGRCLRLHFRTAKLLCIFPLRRLKYLLQFCHPLFQAIAALQWGAQYQCDRRLL